MDGQRGADLAQHGQLAGLRLRLAVEARVLGDQRDLARDRARQIDADRSQRRRTRVVSRTTPIASFLRTIGTTSTVSSTSTGRRRSAASASPSAASGGTRASGQSVIVQCSASSARAARWLQVGEGGRQVERGAQGLRGGEQDLGALGAPQLLGVEARVEDGRRGGHAQRLGQREVHAGEGAPGPAEEQERAERGGVTQERDAEARADFLDLEPAPRLGLGVGGQAAQDDGPRPLGHPSQHVAPGRVGQARDDLRALEADVAAQHQLDAALEEPDAGRVRSEMPLRHLGEPSRETGEIEGTPKGARGLSEEGDLGHGGVGQAGPNPTAVCPSLTSGRKRTGRPTATLSSGTSTTRPRIDTPSFSCTTAMAYGTSAACARGATRMTV